MTTRRVVEWWDCAMDCYRYWRNVHRQNDEKGDRKIDGPSFLVGTVVEYIPITAKDMSRIHQFGPKTLKKFLGCTLRAGEVGQVT